MSQKVLIFHPYLAPYRIDLYNRLAKDYQIEVLLTGGARETNTLGFDLSFVNQQATFKFYYKKNGLRIGRHLVSMVYYQMIKRIKPSIVISHEYGVNTLFAILLKGLFGYKTFVTCDDSLAMAKDYGKCRSLLRNWVVSHSDCILVVHPMVKEYLSFKYNTSNCTFLYFPIIQDDLLLRRKFEDAMERSSEIIDKYHLQNTVTILFVGRLEAVKSPDLLLQVFDRLYQKNHSVRLVFVGDGSLRYSLEEEVASLGLEDVVHFKGRLVGDELYAWYNVAHVFALASNFEPFGAVVNEALVAGCFTVVSDCAGAAALINSGNGYVFKSGNIDSLLIGMQKGIDNSVPFHKRGSMMEESFDDYYRMLSNVLMSSN